jgi:hypothetical protein
VLLTTPTIIVAARIPQLTPFAVDPLRGTSLVFLMTSSAATRAVRWVCKHLLLDILREADGFNTLLRKIVIVTFAAIVPAGCALIGYHASIAVAEGFTPAHTVFIFVMTFCIVLFQVCYAYARCTNSIPDALIDCCIGGVMIALSLLTFCSSFPPALCFATMALDATFVDTPRAPLIMAYALIASLVSCWNTAATTSGDVAPVVLPGVRFDTFSTQLINGVVCTFFVCVPIAACVLQGMKFKQMLAAVKDSADLSRRVANHLQQYDTDAVEQELAEYRDTAAQPDPELLASYEALVANLNTYRPHLPNWMVNNSSSQASSSTASAKNRPSCSSARSASSASSHTHEHVSPGVKTAALTRGGKQPHHSITFASLDFGGVAAGAVTKFVDLTHEWAAACHGSLHSFVGDTLQVSWNATHSVAQPEAKAARFMAKVVTANADPHTASEVAIYGAAFTGRATCEFSGTGRVQALTISMPWRDTLRRCAAFAVTHKTVVVDGATAHASAFAVETRGIDVLRRLEDPSSGLADDGKMADEVHEVVAERFADAEDEWMYAMQRASGTGNDAVTEALRLARAGAVGDAIEKLDGISGAAREAPLVARLRAQLDTQALRLRTVAE